MRGILGMILTGVDLHGAWCIVWVLDIVHIDVRHICSSGASNQR